MTSTTTILTAMSWLEVWEKAAGWAAPLRDLELLRHACAPSSQADVSQLPVGTRDRLLLELRGAMFGTQMQCLSECPECGERCEWSCDTESLLASSQKPSATTPPSSACEWSNGPWRAVFRPVTSGDLVSLGQCADEASAVRRLLTLCVSDAWHGDQRASIRELPDSVLAELSDAMSEADPHGALSLTLTCPACAHTWDSDLDPGAFLWTELDAWAQRTLSDVHVLATAYGWAERDILSMPPARRARYLAMVTA